MIAMSQGRSPCAQQGVNPPELVVITYGAAHIDTICSQEEGEQEGSEGSRAGEADKQ